MGNKYAEEIRKVADELRKQQEEAQYKAGLGKHQIMRGIRNFGRFIRQIQEGLMLLAEAFQRKHLFGITIPDRLNRIAKELENEEL